MLPNCKSSERLAHVTIRIFSDPSGRIAPACWRLVVHVLKAVVMPRILIVEDHPNLLRSITQALRESGFKAVGVPSLKAAKDAFSEEVDLVILDLMLPDGSGLDWLGELRASGTTVAVLILTARDSISDRVHGLDAGADDYLVKPFAIDELLARVRALLRREARPTASLLKIADLQVDLVARTVSRGNERVELQPRQFELLVFLMIHSGEIVTREMIAAHVWKEPSATWTNVIEVHVNQLRKKLESSDRPALLHTVRGQGYRLGDAI
jgi:DNA-binding response OmpR family regulator